MDINAEKADKNEFVVDVDDEEFTDTDLFDHELIAKELESLREPGEAQLHSARGRIEDILERKRLERDLRDFDNEEDELSMSLYE